ncbi:MAG: hypothetical protein AB7O96_02690 [Pseudobdellovibrionaceae bacterium]
MKISSLNPAFSIALPEDATEKQVVRRKNIAEVAAAESKTNQDLSEKETEEGLNRLVDFLKRRKAKGDDQKREDKKRKALSLYETSAAQETALSLKGAKLDKSA